jgi:hypothetical protein
MESTKLYPRMDAEAAMPQPMLDLLLRELLLCAAEDIRHGNVRDALESLDCINFYLDRVESRRF